GRDSGVHVPVRAAVPRSLPGTGRPTERGVAASGGGVRRGGDARRGGPGRGQLRGAAGQPAVGVHPPLPGKPPGGEGGGVVRLHAARRGGGGSAGRPHREGDGSGLWGLVESGNRGVSVTQSTPARSRQKHRQLKVLPVVSARLTMRPWC